MNGSETLTDAPTTGRDLLRWAEEQDRRGGTMLRWWLVLYGSRAGWPSPVNWDAGQVARVYRLALGRPGVSA